MRRKKKGNYTQIFIRKSTDTYTIHVTRIWGCKYLYSFSYKNQSLISIFISLGVNSGPYISGQIVNGNVFPRGWHERIFYLTILKKYLPRGKLSENLKSQDSGNNEQTGGMGCPPLDWLGYLATLLLLASFTINSSKLGRFLIQL